MLFWVLAVGGAAPWLTVRILGFTRDASWLKYQGASLYFAYAMWFGANLVVSNPIGMALDVAFAVLIWLVGNGPRLKRRAKRLSEEAKAKLAVLAEVCMPGRVPDALAQPV